MDNFFAREAKKKRILYITWIKISLKCLHLIGTFINLSCLNVKLLSSMSL